MVKVTVPVVVLIPKIELGLLKVKAGPEAPLMVVVAGAEPLEAAVI